MLYSEEQHVPFQRANLCIDLFPISTQQLTAGGKKRRLLSICNNSM